MQSSNLKMCACLIKNGRSVSSSFCHNKLSHDYSDVPLSFLSNSWCSQFCFAFMYKFHCCMPDAYVWTIFIFLSKIAVFSLMTDNQSWSHSDLSGQVT
uniref:Uncharacterized protein n=1 Tax=Arundo donax TaxID=35708 RepID=A0A0A9HPB3_ARUDO